MFNRPFFGTEHDIILAGLLGRRWFILTFGTGRRQNCQGLFEFGHCLGRDDSPSGLFSLREGDRNLVFLS